MTKKHNLKILPEYFEAVLSGDKPFEIRNNNRRDFQRGDQVLLMECEPLRAIVGSDGLTGRQILADISFVTSFEQQAGYVVFGLRNIHCHLERSEGQER